MYVLACLFFRLSKPIEKKKKDSKFSLFFFSLCFFFFLKKKKANTVENRCNRGGKKEKRGQRAFDNTRVLRTSGWAGRALQSLYIVRVNRIVIVRVGGNVLRFKRRNAWFLFGLSSCPQPERFHVHDVLSKGRPRDRGADRKRRLEAGRGLQPAPFPAAQHTLSHLSQWVGKNIFSSLILILSLSTNLPWFLFSSYTYDEWKELCLQLCTIRLCNSERNDVLGYEAWLD